MASPTARRPEPHGAGGAAGGPRRPPAGALAALRRPAVLVPLLVTLAFAAWMHAAAADQLARTLPTEDAYYVLAVARQAAIGGGVSADGQIATNGFQPLWAALNVPLYAAAGGDRIAGLRLSQLLSTLLWLAFVALVALQARALARRHGGEGATAAAAAAIVVAGSVSVFRLFHNGLETGLTLVLLAASVLVLDRTERWTPRRVLAAGLLLGALALARVDEVVFVAAFGAVALLRAWRGGAGLRAAAAPLAACLIAAVLLSPWIAYNLSLDGSPIPSSGKAESSGVDVAHNLDSALRAAGAWSLPPVLRPSMHYTAIPISEVLSVLALALVAAAVVLVRRRARPRLGAGTVALVAFVALLGAFYVSRFGPWWFMERYLSPLLLLTIPWLATALELGARFTIPARPDAAVDTSPDRHPNPRKYVRIPFGFVRRPARSTTTPVGPLIVKRTPHRRPPRALAALAAVVLLANVPVLAVLATGSKSPPAWTARDSNLGAHPNLNHSSQLAWTRANVAPACTVGAFETGTLLYFRDRTVNLDGKVDHDALEARLAGRSPQYVDARGVDVLVDIESGPVRALAGRREAWRKVEDMGRYEAWVRIGREDACL